MERAAGGGAFVPRYLRRLFVLLLIGLAHALLFWPGDILVTYAVLGVFLIPFRAARPATLLIWALGLLLVPLLITLSLVIGTSGALGGFGLAIWWNVSISGMIATMLGALFGMTLLLAPEQGLVAQAVRRRRQRHQFATEMLVVHLATHENTEAEARESAVAHLEKELNWQPQTVQRILARAGDAGLIARQNGSLRLTPRGRDLARQVATR